ncbi:Lysophospholipid acyltransferase [Cucumispora dikerogammari]|nr:Lysophospholipid acyltransferase [Cucumispora dikerogammari]
MLKTMSDQFLNMKEKYDNIPGTIVFAAVVYSLLIICTIIKHYKLYNFMFIPSILLLLLVFGFWHVSIAMMFVIVNLLLIYILKHENRHIISQVSALTVLFCAHFYYKIINVPETVDICTFLMITTVQFYWIGKYGTEYKFLDIINYLFCPPSIFAGPPMPIKEYMLRLSYLRYQNNKMVVKSEIPKPNIVGSSEVALVVIPARNGDESAFFQTIKDIGEYVNEIHPAINPIILSGIYAGMHLYLKENFPYTTDKGFLKDFGNLFIGGFAFRCKFYFVWTLAEANFYCLGFPNIVNIRPLNIELANNVKDLTASWNIYTNMWLKDSVFDVFKSTNISLAALLTFFVSSFYHGPNICYPLMFLTLSIIVPVIKQNNMFMRDKFHPTVTKILNILVFVPLVAYLMVPFKTLSLKYTLYVWKSVYFFGHLFLFFSILFHFLRKLSK